MEVRVLAEAPVTSARALDPDSELVAAARDEPSAFLTLYDRYFHRVLGYARLHVRDDATCEDVTSTVFTTALAQLPRFRGRGTFAGWLFQIARNTVRDVHRERERARRPLPQAVIAWGPDVEELLLAREQAAQLHVLIRLLEPEQQHLLALRYGAGLAYDEIGAIVGAAPGAVRVRMHRILEELRRRYPDDD